MSRLNWLANSTRFCVAMTVLAYAITITGCRQSTPTDTPPASEHDHDDHDHDHAGHDHDHDHEIDIDSLPAIDTPAGPATLSEGIEQLASMQDAIAKGFADDDVDSIHGQLHSIGGLLEHLESLTASSDLPAEAKEKAGKAIDSLFDAFGDVDAKLHGDTGKDYSDVSDKIDEAVKTLTGLKLP
ncbi:hypothetical protein [Rhodopirellula sallentina]|uniref:Signal peptide protein n=1 Tax=Rhodopirellula sallentina SM41 TaxID=1263870 RepID=M5TXG6_9BACT|nr:hypothetical protein [Rhodopirellula sallentina]EMI53880.1 signal peptide protein [Rhodopirellula sallentina SM41]